MNTPELFLLGAAIGAGFTTVGAAAYSWFRTAHAAERIEVPRDEILERLRDDVATLTKALNATSRARRGGVRRTGSGARRK